ncbi:hypothetical protein [Chryseobacterium sp. Alg-005]|uniref:hypothetical protein n=1 Tax=Chryseobacterium sp. Alg-005 TaxID=3159516 RepID=UPI0036F3CC2B
MTCSVSFKAQVGINTSTPTSTLDVVAKNATGTTTNVDGLLIPRVDRQRAQSMTLVPTSTLIYVNSIATGNQTGTALNIDAVGYYYFNGTVWTKLNPTGSSVNIYNSDGTLNGLRTVNTASNFLTFTNGTNSVGIATNGTEGRLLATGSTRGSLGVTGGNTTMNFFTDNSNASQITTGGSSTQLILSTQGTTATPINLRTNGITRLTVAANGNVGIGTTTPTAQLQTTGNVIVGTAASTNGATGYSTVVRDNTTGELKVASTSTGNTFPFNYATYQINNVQQDWINDFNTNISTSQYTVAVIGSTFDIGGAGLSAPTGGTFDPQNVFAFQSGGTWHLSADYKNGTTSNGANGNWTIYVLIINNTVVKSVGTVTASLGGTNSGSASAPSGL